MAANMNKDDYYELLNTIACQSGVNDGQSRYGVSNYASHSIISDIEIKTESNMIAKNDTMPDWQSMEPPTVSSCTLEECGDEWANYCSQQPPIACQCSSSTLLFQRMAFTSTSVRTMHVGGIANRSSMLFSPMRDITVLPGDKTNIVAHVGASQNIIKPIPKRLPIRKRKRRSPRTMSEMKDESAEDYKPSKIARMCTRSTKASASVASKMSITLLQGPSAYQVKEFNFLPANKLRVEGATALSDYVKVCIICKGTPENPQKEREIFIGAVGLASQDKGVVEMPNLKVTQQALPGRTKGHIFSLKYTLIHSDKPVKSIMSHEFQVWSNINQPGFPRNERETHMTKRRRANKLRRSRNRHTS